MTVDGDTVSAGRRFRRNQLLLLLHPAVHVGVAELGPPSEGLRGPLRRPRASRAVRTVGATAGLMHSRDGSFPRRSVSMLCLTLSQQRASAKAVFKGGLS